MTPEERAEAMVGGFNFCRESDEDRAAPAIADAIRAAVAAEREACAAILDATANLIEDSLPAYKEYLGTIGESDHRERMEDIRGLAAVIRARGITSAP